MTDHFGRQNAPSIEDILRQSPWRPLEVHLDDLRERIDASINRSNNLRAQYRDELLANQPGLRERVSRPSGEAMARAENLLRSGTVAAADGTISPVPLLGGSKIQVGVVIVFNSGEVVDLVTRVFEAELAPEAATATEHFVNLRASRSFSNLLSRAIMLFGERRLLLEQQADWRMLHGELFPHELRTGAGRPAQNLGPAFDVVNAYVRSEKFMAVTEGSDDIDILNAAILLEPGEYIVIRTMADTLTTFLTGDPTTGQARANFTHNDRGRFEEFLRAVGPQVSVVLVKAANKPFMVECHSTRIEEAVSLFLIDSLWTRGLPTDGSALAVRGFPFHIDLADQVARTLFKGAEFRSFVESRLYDLSVDSGVFDVDPRRARA